VDRVLVLEDDVDVDVGVLELLQSLERAPAPWDIILVGHHAGSSRHTPTPISFWGGRNVTNRITIGRPCEKAYGTYGYLISREGASKLLSALEQISKPIDHYTG